MGRFSISSYERIINAVCCDVSAIFPISRDNSRFGEGEAAHGMIQRSSLFAVPRFGGPLRGDVHLRTNFPRDIYTAVI